MHRCEVAKTPIRRHACSGTAEDVIHGSSANWSLLVKRPVRWTSTFPTSTRTLDAVHELPVTCIIASTLTGGGTMRWKRRVPHSAVVLALVAALTGATGVAAANDNSSAYHWHSRPVTYQIAEKSSLPLASAWKTAVDSAAASWTSNSAIHLTRGSDVTYTDAPSYNSSTHLVWWGDIPPEWWYGCPPGITLGCTRLVCESPGFQTCLDGHLVDADLVFGKGLSRPFPGIEQWSWHTNCVAAPADVETTALHEFGHFGGWLGHTSDSAGVMYAYYSGCRRVLTQHDIDSANTTYAGHS
jgi:hypothetical protein